jgi:D-threonate/D-erythronate kinase
MQSIGLTNRAAVYRANVPMTSLRLLADDLTGALDSAAEFVPLTGPVRAFWRGAIPATLPKNAALDSGTRELRPPQAAAIVRDLMRHLSGGAIAFKKVDSLLRGPTIAELAAAMAGWQYCALAPAFPFQGRVTRAGRQYVKHADGDWRPAGDNLVAALLAQGVNAQPGRLHSPLRPGISVFDGETEDDLHQIVHTVRRCPHPALWSGTGGLAQALAAGTTAPTLGALPGPILGLFGTDQSATAAQLAACEPHWMALPDGGSASAGRIAVTLATIGIALASFQLPTNAPRPAAAVHIAQQMDQLTSLLDPPGTVIVAGGETLRSLCQSLGATSLEVQGRIVPGVPRSVICDGRWNGVTVVSKSGAFGHSHLLRDLLPVISERSAS